jgi:protein-disulfide isomerase
MSRSFPVLRAAALVLWAGAAAACGRADAAARQSNTDAGAPAAGGSPSRAERDSVVTNRRDAATTGSTDPDSAASMALMQQADRSRLLGPENGMWVVMISDYQCPYCKQWHDSSMARLKRDYIDTGKIRFAYLHLPLESIHPHARAEAQGSLCAGVQGKFWEYSDSLFANYDAVKRVPDVSPLLSRLARDLRLDVKAFESCRTSGVINALVTNDIAQATQAGVQSTPSFIVGDFLVQGALPYQDFRRAVDTALSVARQRRAR